MSRELVDRLNSLPYGDRGLAYRPEGFVFVRGKVDVFSEGGMERAFTFQGNLGKPHLYSIEREAEDRFQINFGIPPGVAERFPQEPVNFTYPTLWVKTDGIWQLHKEYAQAPVMGGSLHVKVFGEIVVPPER